MKNVPLYALGMALVGCAHQPLGPSSGGIMSASEPSMESAFHSVSAGEKQSARADGMVIERVSDHTIRVMPEAGIGKNPNGTSDDTITNQIQARVGNDVQVQSQAGVVTLRGQVASEHDALNVIHEALDTGGVMAVNTELSFPSTSARGY